MMTVRVATLAYVAQQLRAAQQRVPDSFRCVARPDRTSDNLQSTDLVFNFVARYCLHTHPRRFRTAFPSEVRAPLLLTSETAVA